MYICSCISFYYCFRYMCLYLYICICFSSCIRLHFYLYIFLIFISLLFVPWFCQTVSLFLSIGFLTCTYHHSWLYVTISKKYELVWLIAGWFTLLLSHFWLSVGRPVNVPFTLVLTFTFPICICVWYLKLYLCFHLCS